MRAFLRLCRWWLLAVGFLLAVFAAVLFMVRASDDSSEWALQEVRLGMTPDQVDQILARTSYDTKPVDLWCRYYGDRASCSLLCGYRDHDLRIDFDEGERTVIGAALRQNRPRSPWWERPMTYLRRIRSAIRI